KDETRAYIEHRLKQVGWRNDPRLEDAVFASIHAHTGGIPRRINTLCTRLLLAAFLADKHAVSSADLERVTSELSEEFGEAVSAGANGAAAGAAAEPPTLGGLEKRVVGVEKAMNITLNLIREILRAKEAARAAGHPMSESFTGGRQSGA
ncbi:MAG TPA: hypothetical protein VF262_01865, partial [Burkholderiales bacterium]